MEVNELRKKIYARVDELPTIPAVVPRLTRILKDEEHDIREVIELISQDPALTAKILKVANSAYYGFPQQITTLERAVALLGSNMVKSLAISVGVINSLPKGKGLMGFSVQALWIHSLSVANVASQLSSLTEPKGSDEVYFVIGLLHDIGKLVLVEFFQDGFQQSLNYTLEHKLSLAQAEKEIIGLDHGEVGGILLERWRFPPEIRLPIQFHHADEQLSSNSDRAIAVLHIADEIAREVCVGESGNKAPPLVVESHLNRLGLGWHDLERVKQGLWATSDKLQNFFHAIS